MTVSINGADRSQIASFILLAGQLGLLLLVADVFLIEQTYGFNKLVPIIFLGFVVHALLPHQWRALFFLLLFPVSAITLLGMVSGAVLIGLGVFLFLLCHLPVSFMARAAILIGVGAILAAIRVGAIETTIPYLQVYFQTQTLPFLGAMFMFRTIIYLYDLRHEKGPVSFSQRLGYFFLFPNVCFPLFPVIDYQTYKRTYFDQSSFEIYQKGIDWIFRGITHLLLYRIVYHYFVPDPLSIDRFAEVGQFALSNFLLYLRVSGLFHLIIGILCLFGYNLPETNKRYYLAESFTDFWRRINIYWKDFMMKVFYYPIFLRLRGPWGMTRAMIAATLITFVITWALHSYQWFWLRGSFPLLAQDMIYWGVLAVLVTVNVLHEEKFGRKRKSLTAKTALSLQEAMARSVKVVTMFIVLCLLWSFWASNSIEQWLAIMSVAAAGSVSEWLSFFGLVALAVAVGVTVQLFGDRYWQAVIDRPFSVARRAAWVGSAAILLLAIANPMASNRLDPWTTSLIATITGDRLNTRDQQQLVKGYYEDLLGVESSGAAAWSVRLEQPDDWKWNGAPQSEYAMQTGDIRDVTLLPSIEVVHKGKEFNTNRWGLRGPEIEKSKPFGTYRIAMLGSSMTVGAGVDVEQIFPSLLGRQLNDKNTNSKIQNFEVLNFAWGGDSIIRRLARLEEQAIEFDVDLVVDMSVSTELLLGIRNLRRAVKKAIPDVDPLLLNIAERAKVTVDMSDDEIERRLSPYGEEIYAWGYGELARIADLYEFDVVVFVLPSTSDTDSVYREQWGTLSNLAAKAGLTVVELGGVYGPINDRNNLKLAPWDWHPNSKGHELIGHRIYEELVKLDLIYVNGAKLQ